MEALVLVALIAIVGGLALVAVAGLALIFVFILRRTRNAPPADLAAPGQAPDLSHHQQLFMHDSFGTWK